MVEEPVEVPGSIPQVLRKRIRVEDLGKPPHAYQTVDAGRRVEPSEGQRRGPIDPPLAHGLDAAPGRISRRGTNEGRIERQDDVRVPREDLLQGNGGERTRSRRRGDVPRADELQDLQVDGTGQT